MVALDRISADNASDRELAIGETVNVLARLADDFARIRANDIAPAPEWLPYLAAEYGLGELIPYVPDLAQLIAVGPAWQRKRGTPAAIATGLGWVGYAATLEWALPRRRRWHLWQMKLSRLPDTERPDLDRIDGIASLSDDATSHFWRGYRGYDVRPAESGNRRWGSAMWGASSGVRIRGRGALWSFGRRLDVDRVATQADLTALGAWIPPAGTSDLWADMSLPWVTADYLWAVPGAAARRLAIASDLAGRKWHLVFRDAGGVMIGACRAIRHAVAEAPTGAYRIGPGRWSPSPTPTAALIRATSPFAVPAAGRVVASIGIVSGAALSDGVPPGRHWLTPDEIDLSAGTEIIITTGLALPLAATIREIVTILLRID
jgi:hypothetical protein